MKVLIALCIGLLAGVGGAVSVQRHRGQEVKHTQVVKCLGQQKVEGLPGPYPMVYWMERPNKEVFAMLFNNPAAIPQNVQLKDVAYQDVDANTLHFVKAQIQ